MRGCYCLYGVDEITYVAPSVEVFLTNLTCGDISTIRAPLVTNQLIYTRYTFLSSLLLSSSIRKRAPGRIYRRRAACSGQAVVTGVIPSPRYKRAFLVSLVHLAHTNIFDQGTTKREHNVGDAAELFQS